MIRKLSITIISTLTLAACTSPAVNMTPAQVSMLSDTQLCQLQRGYGWEQKTEIEISQRGINCHPAYMECAAQGLEHGTPEMNICAQLVGLFSEKRPKIPTTVIERL